MKLKFNPNLDFQQEAIHSIVDIFDGQEVYQSRFTVNAPSKNAQPGQTTLYTDTGYGNKLNLSMPDVHDNVVKIQRRNQLPVSSEEEVRRMEFCIEMETGTGKTYVYLRSIMELYQKHRFSKFIIVVPNVSIREGVYKSLQITEQHFRNLYDNLPYHYFIYDSSNPSMIVDFARSPHLQIMIINIQAFNTEDRLINQANDRTSMAPMDLIAETNPIVIVDEPQSTSNTQKAKEAIAEFHPLAQFNYSATHRELINLMYRLDAVEAYHRKLVKQIEVASIQPEGFYNEPYVALDSVSSTSTQVSAKIEVHSLVSGSIKTKVETVKAGDNLELLTSNGVYRDNFIVETINAEKGNEYVTFLNGQFVTKEESINSYPQHEIRRLQIRRTIEEHLDKEKKLNKQGLKVLTLFFIDTVANYRIYDEDQTLLGPYGQIFEEEYKKLIRNPKYRDMFQDEIRDIDRHVSEVHDGYFAQDKKGHWRDTPDTDRSRYSQSAEEVYNLIMKDKEKLLNMDNPLRFIFSHSALKEGWDNPNVFQICTLKEAGGSEIRRRQEIGRGLRLAVNQDGERVYGHDVNLLTVMASESYEKFTQGLQSEMEKAMHRKFGVIQKDDFAVIIYKDDHGEVYNVSKKESTELWSHLKQEGYIQNDGKVKDELKVALLNETVRLPEEYQAEEIKKQVYRILLKKAGSLEIKNRDDRQKIKVRKEVLLSDEFRQLWDRIKYKTRFEVNYDIEEMKRKIIDSIQRNVRVFNGELVYNKVGLDFTEAGISSVEESTMKYQSSREVSEIPDIVSYLQNEVNLTRKTILEILRDSGRLKMLKRNPQQFVQSVTSIIKAVMSSMIVDGIKYHQIGDQVYYSQELFQNEELEGFVERNMIESHKSPYEYVVYDSKIESEIVRDFELSENIRLYAKLPDWFKIDTPLGSYNPDWAVLWEDEGQEKVYFVCESKGSIDELQLRSIELAKITCGRKHFEQTAKGVSFELIKEAKELSFTG